MRLKWPIIPSEGFEEDGSQIHSNLRQISQLKMLEVASPFSAKWLQWEDFFFNKRANIDLFGLVL